MERRQLVEKLRSIPSYEKDGRDGEEAEARDPASKRGGVEERTLYKNPFERYKLSLEEVSPPGAPIPPKAEGKPRSGFRRKSDVRVHVYDRSIDFKVRSNSTMRDVMCVALYILIQGFIESPLHAAPSKEAKQGDDKREGELRRTLSLLVQKKIDLEDFEMVVRGDEEETTLDMNCNLQSFRDKVFEIRRRGEQKKARPVDQGPPLPERNIRQEDFMIPGDFQREYEVYQYVLYCARLSRVLRIDRSKIEVLSRRPWGREADPLVKIGLEEVCGVSVSGAKADVKYRRGSGVKILHVTFKKREEASEFSRYCSILAL